MLYGERMPSDITEYRRVTVNLSPKTAEAVDHLVEYTEENMTTVINKALRLYWDLISTTQDGTKLATVKDNRVEIFRIY